MRPPSSTDQNDDDENNLITLIQRKLFENYHTVAYAIIIGTYLIAFAEYTYLRLSGLFLDKIVYRRTCDKHLNETIVKNEINYASTSIVFLIIGSFQIAVSNA
jgi:hypothetical protein